MFVPEDYDPLRPTPLVVGLHGGGGGGSAGVITGSGESALNWYQHQAAKRGWIVVCPTARAAPWADRDNLAWLRSLIDEMHLLYNVDETRTYLVGHSMGGFGTWHWGAEMADVWAACAPCAGGGSARGELGHGVPIYVFHGTDDGVVGPGHDRAAAKVLQGDKKADFVYTELDGVGHGFPKRARDDIFEFFAARRKKAGKKPPSWPVSSFDRKPGKDEKRLFGDPTKLPDEGDDEDGGDVKALLKALRAGGGAGAEAAEALAAHPDRKTVKSIARLMRDKEATTDARVLAARALGGIATAEAVAALGKHAKDDDFRVVEAVVTALGRTKREDAAPHVVDSLARIGAFFDEQLRTDAGREGMIWRQYEVRLGSLEIACRAVATLPPVSAGEPNDDANDDDDSTDPLRAALRKEVAERVFLREPDLVMLGIDHRFEHVPPRSRATLAAAFTEALNARGGDEALLARLRERRPRAFR